MTGQRPRVRRGAAVDGPSPTPEATGPREVLRGVIQPWGIRVLAAATAPTGHGHMRWRAASGSLFTSYESANPHTPSRVHHGLVERLVRVEHIVEIDERPRPARTGGQAVRFDAVAWLSTTAGPSWVSEGGLSAEGRAAIACDGVRGWLLIDPVGPNEPATDWAAAPEHPCARGRVTALIDVGGTGLWLRATHIQATHVSESGGPGHLVLELAGSPVLPAAGRWTVTRRGPLDSAPSALPPGQPMPVVQPRGDGAWHVADAVDVPGLLRSGSAPAQRTEYGLVHDTGVQQLYFAHPRFERVAVTSHGECGRLRLPPGEPLRLADLGALLRSGGAFAPLAAMCSFHLKAAEMPVLGVDGWHFHLQRAWPEVRPATLVDTGAVQLQLRRGGAAQPHAAPLDIAFSDTAWSASLGPLCIDVLAHGERLLSLAFDSQHADSATAAQLHGARVIPGRVLEPLTAWLPGLWRLSARGGAASGLPARLPLRLADGQLHIDHGAVLDEVDLGFGHLEHARLTLTATLTAQSASVALSLGSASEPATLIAGPHRGAAVVRIGVQGDGAQLDVRMALTLPMALQHASLDSGSACLAVQLQADWGTPVRLGGVASGHAVVEVLDGLAPVSLAIDAPCRVRPDPPTAAHVRIEADLRGGVPLALCGLLDMDAHTRWAWGVDIERDA